MAGDGLMAEEWEYVADVPTPLEWGAARLVPGSSDEEAHSEFYICRYNNFGEK